MEQEKVLRKSMIKRRARGFLSFLLSLIMAIEVIGPVQVFAANITPTESGQTGTLNPGDTITYSDSRYAVNVDYNYLCGDPESERTIYTTGSAGNPHTVLDITDSLFTDAVHTSEFLYWNYNVSTIYASEGGEYIELDLTAVYALPYNIIYNLNDSTDVPAAINDTPYATTYTTGTSVTLPTNVTRPGYIFTGWYLSPDDTGDPVTVIGAEESGDKIFYAQWSEKKNITLVVTIEDWTYGDTAKTPDVTGNLGNGTPVLYYYKLKTADDSAYTTTVPVNVGEYSVKAEVPETADYKSGTSEPAFFTISPADLTVTPNDKTINYGQSADPSGYGVTYDGFVSGENASVLGGSLSYQFLNDAEEEYSAGDLAGNYRIKISGLTSTNYNIEYGIGTLTVAPKEIPVTWTGDTFTYTGNAKAPTATVDSSLFYDTDYVSYFSEGPVVTVTAGPTTEGKAINVGDYTATAALDFSGDTAPLATCYTLTGATHAFSITAGEMTFTAPTAIENLKYTGEAHELITEGTVTYGTLKYALGTDKTTVPADSAFTYTASPSGTNAGKYYVWYKAYPINENYASAASNPTNPGCIEVPIANADAEVVTPPTGIDNPYTGESQALVSGGSVTGGTLVYSESKTGTYSETVPAKTDAGTYTVWYKVQGDENHNGTEPASVTAKINPVAVTVTITGHTDTVAYDGSSHTVTGYDASDDNTLYTATDYTFTGTKSITQTNAGIYNMGLAASDFTNTNNNFNVTFVIESDGKLTISRKAVTVKADDKGKAFGKDDPELTATVTGTITPDTVTYTLSRAVGNNVGTYTITASGSEVQGNYTVTFVDGTFTITAAAATVTGVTANSRTYDGNAEALVSGGTVTGGTLVYALGENAETAPASGYAAAVPKGTKAGTYFVWYYVDPDSNHTASAKACATAVIEKAGISPTVTITGWKYGEYDSVVNAPKLTDGSNPGSGTVGYTYAVKGSTVFTDEVPTNKGDYTVKATIAETDNYKSGEATKDFSITAAQAAATAPTANDRTYDGTEKALVTGGSADFGELVFSTTETGTYSATVPTGTDAGPYIVWYKATGDANHEPSAPASIEVNISKLNITATITGHTDTVTYDGNEHTVTGYAASYSNTLYTDSDYTFTGTKSITQTNANKYNMGLLASQFTNNNNNFSVTFAVTDGWLKIEKAAMEVTKPTANTLTYNGIARALVTAGSVEGGTMKYAVGNDDVTAPDDSKFDAVIPKRANAGNYFVWYLAIPDSNHNKLTVGNPACVTVSIDKATATVTAPTATNPDYNGSAQELVTGGSTADGTLVYSDSETGTYSATIPKETDVGPYIVWYKATGDENHNASDPASVSCKINPLAVTATITGHTGTETYTGTEYTVSGYDASYSSTLYTDTNYTFNGTDSVSGTNAGTYLIGLKAGDFTNINNNFTVTFDVTDGLLKIEKADITPTISIASAKVYDGTAIEAATVSGNPESGTETITYVGRDETTYNSTVPPTNVGKYSVSAVVAETANYNGATTAAVDFEITATDITPGITITGWTYGEAANDPVVSGNTGSGTETITYTGRNTTTYAESAAVPTGAGDYTVKVVIGATENYNGGTATADFTIAKADIAPTISIASAKVYDGTAIEAATVSGNTGNGTETITYVGRDGTTYNSDVPPTNVGKYSVSAVVAETANYNGATTASVDFEITAADITPGITITGWTYGEAANDPVVSGNTGSGTETITYTGRNTTTYAESAAVPTGAGDYTVKVVISATENYNGGTATANFTIAQLEAVLSWDDLSFVYDGNEHKPTAVVTNLAGTDTCTVTVDGAQKNTGTYTATASALSNENYKLPTANTQSFTISQLEAVLSWDDLSFVYDGNEHKPTAVVTNLAGTDTCTVTVDGAQTNAGTYTATASALSNENYKLPAANTQSFTIAQIPVTVKADDKTKTYGEEDPEFTVAVSGTLGSDTVSYTISRDAGKNIGFYTITPSGDASQGNYSVTFETASLEIVAADMTITAPTANTLTYTGADMSLVTAGTVIGGTMKYAPGADDTTAPALTEFDAAVPTGRNAGTFYVWYIALPDGNHNETTETPACVKVTIAKADPIVTPPAAKTLNYTAEAQELITAGNAVGGTMTYSTEKEGTYSGTLPTGTNVGTYTVWYKVTGDENHNDIAPASVEAVIEDTARIITPPTGKTGLRFNGRMQVLIYAGSTNFGKMVYSLDEVNYSEELPQALYDGTYTVWYKVIEDVLHGDSEPASLQVTIASPRHGPSGTPVPVTPSPTPSSHVTPSAGGEDSDPEVNTLLSAKLIENNNLLVTWKKIDKAKKYVLYAKKDDGEYVVVSTTEKMRVVIKNPKINVTYHLMLKYSSSDTVVSDDLKGGTSEYRTSLYVSVSPKITNITRSGSKNKITWEKMKGVKTYYVCRLENNKPVIIKKTSKLSATVAGSKSTKYVVLAKINKKWTKARKSDAKSYRSFHRT